MNSSVAFFKVSSLGTSAEEQQFLAPSPITCTNMVKKTLVEQRFCMSLFQSFSATEGNFFASFTNKFISLSPPICSNFSKPWSLEARHVSLASHFGKNSASDILKYFLKISSIGKTSCWPEDSSVKAKNS